MLIDEDWKRIGEGGYDTDTLLGDLQLIGKLTAAFNDYIYDSYHNPFETTLYSDKHLNKQSN